MAPAMSKNLSSPAKSGIAIVVTVLTMAILWFILKIWRACMAGLDNAEGTALSSPARVSAYRYHQVVDGS